MKKTVDTMSAEEFFDVVSGGESMPRRTRKRRGEKSGEKSFVNAKVKMVMRIYGVSRAKALEIIAKRESEIQKEEEENG